MMRVWSLWQPWATFCVLKDPLAGLPAKQWETRHWNPIDKGVTLPCEVAIHATKKFVRDLTEGNQILRSLERRLGPHVHESGAIIGVGQIVEVKRTEELYPPNGIADIDIVEFYLGNWEPGRFAVRLAEVRPLRTPVRLKGRQSVLWVAPPELEAQIRAAL